ncbi:MAG TPA: SUMF1/EgtB/PvdO family nonheme iron enzyme [Labilithrix sp.]|nr:SUMF1/EgtB/PvdO family nonheme iron enzyme [Labilithrix sp.]
MARRRRSLAACALGLGVALAGAEGACTSFGTDDGPAEAGAGEGGSATDGSSTLDSSAVPDSEPAGDSGAQPPGTVAVGGFFIDAHEATNGEFDAFLEAFAKGEVTATRSLQCKWKGAPSRKAACNPGLGPLKPATCVDWCDADLYCAHRGERMCGKRIGGAAERAKLTDRSHSQWMRACASENASQTYPYPGAGDPSRCNAMDHASPGLADVMSFPMCQGSVPGLYDMSGNVLEWEDACETSLVDGGAAFSACYARGGSFANPTASASCNYISPPYLRSDAFDNIGIRCCSR